MTDHGERRWAWAEVDSSAIAHNIGVVKSAVGDAAVWAVVKADGYGHGAVAVARVALSAGAVGLCVALVQEGVELREAGVEAPILILSEQPVDQSEAIVTNSLIPTLSSHAGRQAIEAAAIAADVSSMPVHVKVDTGMHRAGAEPGAVVSLLDAIAESPQLHLQGLFTHLAKADEPSDAANDLQLGRFREVIAAAHAAGHRPELLHAANSAAALGIPASRLDMVRVGIVIYGIEPGPSMRDLCGEIRPALSFRARISRVHRADAGEGVSYGHQRVLERPTTIATVPVGYADGVPRRLWATGGEVLVRGRRLPILGVVTMDQMMIDCTPLDDNVEPTVQVGDEVILLGTQKGAGAEATIRSEDWAERLDTIGYEIVCGISRRIARVLL